MKPMRGYYSLIQFCPDRSRAEVVNLGTILFCPDAQFIAAKTSANNRRAERLVGKRQFDRENLNVARLAIERRLQIEKDAFRTVEDFQKFVDTRANILKLTQPRPLKVFDPQQDLDRLFAELVGGKPRQATPRFTLPKLDDVFRQLELEGRAKCDFPIKIPVVDRVMRIPYGYQNGVLNLVVPKFFSSDEGTAIRAAKDLALDGDLLYRHFSSEADRKKLIVVSKFTPNRDTKATEDRIFNLLTEYQVHAVREAELDEFTEQILRDAHPVCSTIA